MFWKFANQYGSEIIWKKKKHKLQFVYKKFRLKACSIEDKRDYWEYTNRLCLRKWQNTKI